MKTIFVSSTFKDMHYERDAIRDITAPSLNEEAKKHGDEVDFCDLRWGINTGDLDTEEGSRKVLDVCLDEIDRSQPPMVVLLGYRYGWIPDGDLIKTAAERKHLELEDLEKSVTALEIEYGALCDKEKLENTLFYFREIEGDAPSDYRTEDKAHEEKVSALKNRIKTITGGNFKTYTLTWNGSDFDGVDAFADMLAQDIREMLLPQWRETEMLTDFQRERRTHASFIREKNMMFRARQAEAEKLIQDALSQPVTIIKGEVGSGKSTLFSHMATELEKSEWIILPFISGLTTESNSARDIIENTVYFIEEELHLEHYRDETDPQTGKKKTHTPDEWKEKLAELCSAYAETGAKLLIMVDAADQLTQSEERDRLDFVPLSVSEKIHFVMTCTTDFKTPVWRDVYTLQHLNNEDKRDVIDGILARNGRELSQPVINKMLELEASHNPLYLSLLVQRLLMMNREDFAAIRSQGDGMAAIEQHQLELIKNKCPDGLDEMSAALLSEAGKRINEKLISKAAQYLAASRSGLRRKDLAALLGGEWSEIDFSHFVNYMYDCFLLRDDGRYDFTHKSIRAGFRSRCEDLDGVNREILEYFKSLKADDPVRVSEIIYHVIAADDKKFFVDYSVKHLYRPYTKSCAARDVYAQCMADNGQWIIAVFEEAKKYEADEELLGNLTLFCNSELYNAFGGSQKELETSLSILTANLDLSEYLYRKLKSNTSMWYSFISYNMVAGIYETLGGNNNLKLALELCEKGQTIAELLVNESGTTATVGKENLSISYAQAARIYEALDGSDNLMHALELYRKALAISEQLAEDPNSTQNKSDVSCRYDGVAGIYEKLGGNDNLKLALELYEKSQTIDEQLVNELGTTQSKRNLSSDYSKVARIYRKLGSIDDLMHALELCRKALAINEQLAEKLNATQSKRTLSINYSDIAGIYETLGGNDNLMRALALYEKSLTIDEQLAKELGTNRSKSELSHSYIHVAAIHEKFGNSDNLVRALKLYEKALAINEQLAEELNTTQSKRELSISYHRVAGIYEALGGNDNLMRALNLCEKGQMIAEQLAKESGTTQNIRDLSISYYSTAGIYKKLGGSDNLMHALTLYEKNLTINEQLAKELGTTQSKSELSVYYNRVAGIYAALGGSDNLMHALTLYEKNLTINEQLAKELGTTQSKRSLSVNYYMVAKIYETLGGSDNLMHALEMHKKGLTISEHLAKELGTTQSKEELSIGYASAAGIYEALGSSDNLRYASICYDHAAGIYAALSGNDNLLYALELYGKALTIDEHLAKELGTDQSKKELSISYDKVAEIYKALGGSDNLMHALVLYGKALAIDEQRMEELDTAENKTNLSISYYKVAAIYEKLGGNDNLMRALEMCEKSLSISEQLAEELGTPESKRDLSIRYYKVAGIYEKLGGNNNLIYALKLYEKDRTISEQLAKELGTPQSQKDLSISYIKVAGILEKVGGSENLVQTLYHRALAIKKSLADTLHTLGAYDDLAACILETTQHPSISLSDKKELLTYCLGLSKELYEKTNLEKYRSYIEKCEELLSSC
ncbi:MAG: DUF4062 domain-containing protein [Candidatus Gastranaerophilales bacterium]|nr:DUF4062 domain-containing protein [Candidatus Gastranaerophilales bacterium]